jgi:Heavy-metal resistance protein CzcE
MKNIALVTLAALSLQSSLAFAVKPSDYYGEAVSGIPGTRTVVLSNSTKYLNVTNRDVVRLVHGARNVVWKFDGIKDDFNLQEVLPADLVDHKVMVYVNHIDEYK